MTDDIYRKQQFGLKIGFGRLPALLIVDFVNGFTDPKILGGGNIVDAVEATKPLLAFFRKREAAGRLHPHRLCRRRRRLPAYGARKCRGCAN